MRSSMNSINNPLLHRDLARSPFSSTAYKDASHRGTLLLHQRRPSILHHFQLTSGLLHDGLVVVSLVVVF